MVARFGSSRLAFAAAVISIAFGCASLPPPVESAGASRPSRIPLEADPGPATDVELSPMFVTLTTETPGGWLRTIVDLRERVDLAALMADQRARNLTRAESRRETLAALAEVAARGSATLEPVLNELLAAGHVDYFAPLRHRNGYFVSLRADALARLQAHPAIARIEPEYDSVREARRAAGAQQRVGLAPPIPPGDSWGVEMLGVRELWSDGVDGRGVVVASLDSGVIGMHDALREGTREGSHWYDPVAGSTVPTDTVPHGSQVLSCAVGRPVDGRALGVAPGARWAAALSNQFNSYNNVNTALAAEWLIFEIGPDVVLGAWGHGKASCDPRDRVTIEALRATGAVPVFAAGNDGPDPSSVQAPVALGGFFPAGAGILSVAAVDRDGAVIDASSRGPSPCGAQRPVPDVAAPGWMVPVPTAGRGGSLTLASGTSMAVGFVGGTAALILQVAPQLAVWDVEAIVRETARDIDAPGVDEASGYGLVDPRAAVARARESATITRQEAGPAPFR